MTKEDRPTLQFEGVKIAFKQDSKSGYILTIAIHPNDVPDELYKHPLGQRYMVVMAEFEDTPPKEAKKEKKDKKAFESVDEGERVFRRANSLCRDADFQSYVAARCPMFAILTDEQDPDITCRDMLKAILKIDTFRMIRDNAEATQAFSQFLEDFDDRNGTKPG